MVTVIGRVDLFSFRRGTTSLICLLSLDLTAKLVHQNPHWMRCDRSADFDGRLVCPPSDTQVDDLLSLGNLSDDEIAAKLDSDLCRGKSLLTASAIRELAQRHGDDVLLVATGRSGSREGDFVVSFAGPEKSAVVEDRNCKQMSLPAIMADLDREMAERAVDFAMYVFSSSEMLP